MKSLNSLGLVLVVTCLSLMLVGCQAPSSIQLVAAYPSGSTINTLETQLELSVTDDFDPLLDCELHKNGLVDWSGVLPNGATSTLAVTLDYQVAPQTFILSCWDDFSNNASSIPFEVSFEDTGSPVPVVLGFP